MNLATTGLLVAACVLASTRPALGDDCLSCHTKIAKLAVAQWEASAHKAAGVGCADCHGEDHALIDEGKARVGAKACGRCHEKASQEHSRSRHGMGLHSGWGCTRNQSGRDPRECRFCHEEGSTAPRSEVHCARFLKQSSEMGEAGCNRCHQVERSCASCHSAHDTDLAIVRSPTVCAKCHMGPDHPQWEMWQTSQHGTLHATAGDKVGPSCQTCHMPAGTHDVSRGLTMTPAGALYPEAEAKEHREQMLAACGTCHAERFARRELERGDRIREQSLALVKQAEDIVLDLSDHGLLDPMPESRPPHPLRGKVLVLDAQMLYEDTSHIERLLFKMKKYDLAKTVKGAYHQNPAYAHWYGNAELKMDLVDIRAEARRLRRAGSGTIEGALRALEKKLLRGAVTAEQYEHEKRRLLEQYLSDGTEGRPLERPAPSPEVER